MITDGEGRDEAFEAGGCFVVPRGLEYTYELTETTREFHAMLESDG